MTPPEMRLLPCGDAAVLVELDDLDAVLALAATVDAARSAGPFRIVDVVPAARTVLVRCRPGTDLTAVARWLRGLDVSADRPDTGAEVTLAVVYDGDDLDEVGRLTGLGSEEVVARHQATAWRVAFTGFAPGFGYLVGGDGSLAVPRRDEPRVRVPAGAVGLAAEFTGVYPRSSPGGWRLIGRTETPVWDPDRTPPALLTPGTRVRFEAAVG